MTRIAHWPGWGHVSWRPLTGSPTLEAYHILHFAFAAIPIIAGLDKFTMALVNWDQYLAPVFARMLGGYGHEFMLAVGVIEVLAGIGVALKPKIFGYVVAAWLFAIVINLLLTGMYYDIALRDLGLCVGALALARLSREYDHHFERRTESMPPMAT